LVIPSIDYGLGSGLPAAQDVPSSRKKYWLAADFKDNTDAIRHLRFVFTPNDAGSALEVLQMVGYFQVGIYKSDELIDIPSDLQEMAKDVQVGLGQTNPKYFTDPNTALPSIEKQFPRPTENPVAIPKPMHHV
jgi:hypothetical protein